MGGRWYQTDAGSTSIHSRWDPVRVKALPQRVSGTNVRGGGGKFFEKNCSAGCYPTPPPHRLPVERQRGTFDVHSSIRNCRARGGHGCVGGCSSPIGFSSEQLSGNDTTEAILRPTYAVSGYNLRRKFLFRHPKVVGFSLEKSVAWACSMERRLPTENLLVERGLRLEARSATSPIGNRQASGCTYGSPSLGRPRRQRIS